MLRTAVTCAHFGGHGRHVITLNERTAVFHCGPAGFDEVDDDRVTDPSCAELLALDVVVTNVRTPQSARLTENNADERLRFPVMHFTLPPCGVFTVLISDVLRVCRRSDGEAWRASLRKRYGRHTARENLKMEPIFNQISE